MLNKVLVGTDFSDPSLAVLDYLPRLKDAGLHDVLLAHVTHPPSPGVGEVLMEGVRSSLDEQANHLREHGLDVETVIEHGATAITLADLAERHGADALVVGSHGRSLLGRILLGSVSMSVLHQSRVPVLIVRVELCRTDEGISCELQPDQPFDHILFPTDFSEAADFAFERMTDLVARSASRVTLLHVHNPPAHDDDEEEYLDEEEAAADVEALHEEDRKRLKRMADGLRDRGVENVGMIVTTGSPAVSATRFAEAQDVSLIALGTQGRGAMEELVVGSVALKIARTSPVPVLMIPHRP
ncbi:MAG: universal stress protein [Armatimonadota bacterium]